MAIYTYKKAPIKYVPVNKVYEQILASPEEHQGEIITAKKEAIMVEVPRKRLTMWDILAGFAKDFNELMIKSRVAGMLVPLVLILVGVNIIYREVWPQIEQQIKLTLGYYDVSTVPLVAGDYVERAQYLSNPGSEYFAKLNEEATSASILQSDPLSLNYTGTFKLSIPSLELIDLSVGANVDSGVKDVYNRVLNQGLAHFKGTGLPFSNIKNNIVIYGHSSSGDYFERTRDVAGAFSRLNKIKIGDIIDIEIEGKKYQYRVVKSKIVKPDDVSIVTGEYNRRTLTLFTCFPNGNSANRFVAIARPVDETVGSL